MFIWYLVLSYTYSIPTSFSSYSDSDDDCQDGFKCGTDNCQSYFGWLNENIDTDHLPLTTEWSIFWIALNTSYVMEFFLNSLVKRGVLSQRYMMILNGLLMCSASLAAICAVNSVRLEAAVLSLLFNFGNRGHDVINTLIVACIVSYI